MNQFRVHSSKTTVQARDSYHRSKVTPKHTFGHIEELSSHLLQNQASCLTASAIVSQRAKVQKQHGFLDFERDKDWLATYCHTGVRVGDSRA